MKIDFKISVIKMIQPGVIKMIQLNQNDNPDAIVRVIILSYFVLGFFTVPCFTVWVAWWVYFRLATAGIVMRASTSSELVNFIRTLPFLKTVGTTKG